MNEWEQDGPRHWAVYLAPYGWLDLECYHLAPDGWQFTLTEFGTCIARGKDLVTSDATPEEARRAAIVWAREKIREHAARILQVANDLREE